MKTIMIVDDDPDDRLIFKGAVEQMGLSYEYCEAQNGIEALKYLKGAHSLPDFIFLDLNMPIMDGKECLAELKKDERLKDIPVSIYSTAAYGKTIESILSLGADYYLLKPFDIKRIAGEIATAIKKVKELRNYD